jgi:hypothetical protein
MRERLSPSVEVQKMIGRIEGAGVEVKTIESCERSHSPFLSMPEEVVEVVDRGDRSALIQ